MGYPKWRCMQCGTTGHFGLAIWQCTYCGVIACSKHVWKFNQNIFNWEAETAYCPACKQAMRKVAW